MEPTLSDRFVEGIWAGKHGLRSLCWQAVSPGSRIEYFPSWSWASVAAPVEYSLLGSDKIHENPVRWLAEILGFNPELSCARTGTQRSVMMRASLITEYELRPSIHHLGSDRFHVETHEPDHVKMDRECDATPSRGTYLVVARFSSGWSEKPRLICLLVEPTTLGTNTYRRVGIGGLRDDEELWRHVEQNRVISIQ